MRLSLQDRQQASILVKMKMENIPERMLIESSPQNRSHCFCIVWLFVRKANSARMKYFDNGVNQTDIF